MEGNGESKRRLIRESTRKGSGVRMESDLKRTSDIRDLEKEEASRDLEAVEE